MKSPDFLNMALGTVCIGYQASSHSVRSCNGLQSWETSKKVCYNYSFPPWLLHHLLHIAFAYTRFAGPELCIQVVGVRPDYDTIINLIIECSRNRTSIELFQYMLSSGKVSVLDLFPRKRSILNVGNLSAYYAFLTNHIRSLLFWVVMK